MPEQLASGDRQVSVEPDVIWRHPCNEDTIAGRGAIEHIPDQDSARSMLPAFHSARLTCTACASGSNASIGGDVTILWSMDSTESRISDGRNNGVQRIQPAMA